MKNLSAVDLNLLVAFDALLCERNVTRAARRIGLSQPALSRALHRLRDIFDDPLFERREGLMQPTEQALKLGKPLRRALDEIQSALGPSDFDPRTVRATITIGSIDFYDLVFVPALISQICSDAPGLDLVVKTSNRLRVLKQFANNEIDLAIMPISDSITELHVEPLFTESAVTMMRKGHPLARKMTIDDFADAGHVTVAVEGQGVNWIDAALASRGLRRRIVLTLPNFAAVPFAVGASDLISTLPSRLLARLGNASHVISVAPPFPPRFVTVDLAWHPRSAASPLHTWLRTTIKKVAATI